jgi:hypothetical protein
VIDDPALKTFGAALEQTNDASETVRVPILKESSSQNR